MIPPLYWISLGFSGAIKLVGCELGVRKDTLFWDNRPLTGDALNIYEEVYVLLGCIARFHK